MATEKKPITRQQMLDQMHLKEPDHTDLVDKFTDFYNKLKPEQKRVVKETMPRLEQAAKSFSGSVTPDELRKAAGAKAEAIGFWGFAFVQTNKE